ncbi:MAG: hypothetical protein WCN92_11970, partial [Eubacteriales bacterium]
GCKWNGKSYYGISEWAMYKHKIKPQEMMDYAKQFNPVSFSMSREKVTDKFVWSSPDYIGFYFLIFMAITLFILGIVFFQKRKAEICGTIGSNKLLNFLSVFILGFYAFCYCVADIYSLFWGITIGFVVYIFIYLAADLALKRNLKEWKKGLVKLPLHIGVSILIVLAFSTGLFGFSSKVPKIENIESAEISCVTNVGLFAVEEYPPEDTILNYDSLYETMYLNGMSLIGLQSKEDLKTIVGIHNLIVKSGKLKIVDKPNVIGENVRYAPIFINYHLKNGRTMQRFYSYANLDILNAMLSIDETDGYRTLINNCLTQSVSKKADELTATAKTILQSSANIYIIPNYMNTINKLVITQKERQELLEALANDLTAQTAKQKLYPEHPALGEIQFDATKGNDFLRGKCSNGTIAVPVTLDMKNTIRFFENNGTIKLFNSSNDCSVVAAKVITASKVQYSRFYYYYEYAMSYHFMGSWNKTPDCLPEFKGAYRVTDNAILKDMVANAHIAYYNGVNGYFVEFELSNNGGYTTMYIPANKIPRGVLDSVTTLSKN